MVVKSVLKISREHEQKDFLRAVAIYLAKQEATPTDILEVQFSNVNEFEQEYVVMTGDASVDYSCSIGYDRKEIYYEQVKKYNSSTKSYYYANEQRTRTVTDWQPHSGHNQSRETSIVGNAATQDDYRTEREILHCYQTCREESKQEVAIEMEINPEAYELAKWGCIAGCFYSVRLPGDRQRDKDYNGTVDVKAVSGLIVPEVSATYEYQGKTYKTSAIAAGELNVKAEYPDIKADVSKEAKNAVKHFKLLAIVSLVVGVVLNLLMSWIGSWCFLAYIAALTFLILYISLGNKKMKSIFEYRQAEKKKDLIAFLEKNGMAPLTEAELASFAKK